MGRHRRESKHATLPLGSVAILTFPSLALSSSSPSHPSRRTLLFWLDTTPKDRCSTHPADEDAMPKHVTRCIPDKNTFSIDSNEVGRKMYILLRMDFTKPKMSREKKMVRCALNAKHVAHAGYQCTLLHLPTGGRQSIIRWSNHIMLYR